MAITGPQARAARALVQLSRAYVARRAELDEPALDDFETGRGDPGEDAKFRLKKALEDGGAVFLSESREHGVGVRLKFTKRDVRAINKMEGEGGPVGDDDV